MAMKFDDKVINFEKCKKFDIMQDDTNNEKLILNGLPFMIKRNKILGQLAMGVSIK